MNSDAAANGGSQNKTPISFEELSVTVPNRCGVTKFFTCSNMTNQLLCTGEQKEAGIATPNLIYDSNDTALSGVNHTYQIPNGGRIRLTYAERTSDIVKDNTSATVKYGLFGDDNLRTCGIEYCQDISKVCGFKSHDRRIEFGARYVTVANATSSDITFKNGHTMKAIAAVSDLHNTAWTTNGAGATDLADPKNTAFGQCGITVRCYQECKDNLALNINTAAENRVIGGELSYDRYVHLGSWCSPKSGCPDRIGIKLQCPDYLREDTKAADSNKNQSLSKDVDAPNVCQISYCTRILGFEVPMFIARATNLNGDKNADAWVCGVEPRASMCLNVENEFKGCECPEGGEDEDQE